ncbi:MAG TPA: Crp/Fnr family transcriptional regulator [Terriglobales bacterium]|nr:Crp/Fnr family transcriptional regulator [Terriglobales bacterium]
MAQRSRPQQRIDTRLPVDPAGAVIIRPQKRVADLDYGDLFAKLAKEKPLLTFSDGEVIYSQGDAADAIFCIRTGRVKLSVVSPAGKEAIVSILESGCFFGEGSLIPGQPVRLSTAKSMGRSAAVRFEKSEMIKRLHEAGQFCDAFISYLVARAGRVEADLVDQLFNSTEKRLARVLLLFANFDKEGEHKSVIPKISQETLAQMVGASRARVSSFLNKFRKLGFIEYNGGLHVHSSLLNVILRD